MNILQQQTLDFHRSKQWALCGELENGDLLIAHTHMPFITVEPSLRYDARPKTEYATISHDGVWYPIETKLGEELMYSLYETPSTDATD